MWGFDDVMRIRLLEREVKREVVYACIAWVFWLSWKIDFRLLFGLEVVIGVDEANLIQKHDFDSSFLSLPIMLNPHASGCQPEHSPQSHERPGQLYLHSHHLARRNRLRQ
jgi:hypothetical protein